MSRSLLLLFLVLASCFNISAQTNCGFTPQATITNVSCNGLSNGKISLDYTCVGTQPGNCYTSTPVPVDNCTNCGKTFTTNQDITVGSGIKGCIQQGVNLNVNNAFLNGGKLVICGTATISNVNLSGTEEIIILGTATFNNFNFNSSGAKVTNYGTANFNNNLVVGGKFVNYGYVKVTGDLNVNSVNAELTNLNKIDVGITFNNSKVVKNYGTINVTNNFENNSGGNFTNYCTLNVTNNFLNDGASTFDNYSKIIVGKTTTLNGSGILKLRSASRLTTLNLVASLSRLENPETNCSGISVSGHSTINGSFYAAGPVEICDPNGIEINNSVPANFLQEPEYDAHVILQLLLYRHIPGAMVLQDLSFRIFLLVPTQLI